MEGRGIRETLNETGQGHSEAVPAASFILSSRETLWPRKEFAGVFVSKTDCSATAGLSGPTWEGASLHSSTFRPFPIPGRSGMEASRWKSVFSIWFSPPLPT